ncbi:hypothetical protein CA13_01620 [Planctomycetes bacterium CA13]|uniref:Uncharacterized protein n=1 Tax=Novipirellula herctigrandis TaxID=2527986 RepID=A0A5C5YUW6_9BACT|nr:hypothetical protein CA13_01620 [Planctomycetes bacterium CA13]
MPARQRVAPLARSRDDSFDNEFVHAIFDATLFVRLKKQNPANGPNGQQTGATQTRLHCSGDLLRFLVETFSP